MIYTDEGFQEFMSDLEKEFLLDVLFSFRKYRMKINNAIEEGKFQFDSDSISDINKILNTHKKEKDE